ncbi:MAG: TonB family protein [Nitrospira sp.]|nr:TonB family protein [Nitrospira sp.]
MTVLVAYQQTDRHLRKRGWIYSALLHGVMGGGVIALLSSLSPSMETEPFQWNVALMESPIPQPAADAFPDITPPQKQSEPVVNPVERQIVQRQEAQAPPPIPEVVAVNQTASTVLGRTVSPPPEETRQAVESAPAQHVLVADEQPIETASATALELPRPTTTELQAAVSSTPQETISTEPAVATVPSPAATATKADYAWLMKALLGRINELKSYPHVARINHWEGKVVLRAVIRDDGEVIMIDVQESSGRPVLDNDAMETLRRASPLKLEQPLGRPQVAILMPISYSLR